MGKHKEVKQICEELYAEKGSTAVYDYVRKNNIPVEYKHCPQCDADTPALDGECLCCGSDVVVRTRYVVRLEVERIDTYADGEEDFSETDSAETAGKFKTYDEAVEAQCRASNLILKGYVNP